MAKDTKDIGRPIGPDANYRRVAQNLRKRLMEDEWPNGTALPSYRKLAKEYEVGQRVIRLAFELLKKEDRVEILPRKGAVSRSQGYVVSATSLLAALVMENSIGSELNDPDNIEILRGVQSGLGKECDPLLMTYADGQSDSPIPAEVTNLKPRGILLMGPFSKNAAKAFKTLAPTSWIEPTCEDWILSYAKINYEEAAAQTFLRLFKLGHTKIGWVYSKNNKLLRNARINNDISNGIQQAYLRAQIAKPKTVDFKCDNTKTASSLLQKHTICGKGKFSALLVDSVQTATLLQNAATVNGNAIPSDLSIAVLQPRLNANAFWSGPQIDYCNLGYKAVFSLVKLNAPPMKRTLSFIWNPGESIAEIS